MVTGRGRGSVQGEIITGIKAPELKNTVFLKLSEKVTMPIGSV